MRESFGGSFLLSISITFIVLFASFLAISINYSRAFTVKNEIISIIENKQGFRGASTYSPSSCNDESTECEILKYLSRVGYSINSTSTSPVYCPDEYNIGGARQQVRNGGYCIKLICTMSGTGRNAVGTNYGSGYYVVTTFVRIEFPIIWTGINIPITGQTMTLYYNSTSLGCSNT